MPHEAGHTEDTVTTQVIPPVQLPPGVVPSPQSGTSQDTLNLAKQQAVNPLLPQGTAITPVAQNVQTNEFVNTMRSPQTWHQARSQFLGIQFPIFSVLFR